jgi:hypothetical protein
MSMYAGERYMRETEYYVGWVGGQVGLIVGAIFGSHHADDDRGSNSIPVILVLQILKNTVTDVQYAGGFGKSGRIRQELALLVSKST